MIRLGVNIEELLMEISNYVLNDWDWNKTKMSW